MKNLTIKSVLIIVVLIFSLSHAKASEDNLYQALGGEPVINNITKELLDRILTNEKIAFLFVDTDRDELHLKITSLICMETGGPCVYEGLDMIETHGGMDIKYSEFDVFVSDFISAMEAAKVPFRLQNQVLAIFAPMREDITYE